MKTLKEVIDTPPDSYIEGGFKGVVSATQTKQNKSGKPFYTASISDGPNVVEAISFGKDFSAYTGKEVAFTGMGIKRSPDYNGRAKVSLGDRSIWTVTAGGAVAPEPQSTKGAPAQGAIGNGQRFGMCFKLAGDYWLKAAHEQSVDEFVESVGTLAAKLNAEAIKSEAGK